MIEKRYTGVHRGAFLYICVCRSNAGKMRFLDTVVFLALGIFLQSATADEVTTPSNSKPDIEKSQSVDPNQELSTLANDYWAWRLKQEPEMSTRYGTYKYNDKLESFTYGVYTERLDQVKSFLEILTKLDRDKLSTSNQISYDVLQNTLQTYVDGYKWKDYGNINPFNFIEGFHKNPSGYTLNIPFDTQGDFLNYVKRVELLSQQIDEKLELARRALDFGHTYHNVSVNRIPKQLDDTIVDHPTKFALYKPFKDHASEVFIDDISNIRSYIDQRLKRAISNLLDKLRELKTFIITVATNKESDFIEQYKLRAQELTQMNIRIQPQIRDKKKQTTQIITLNETEYMPNTRQGLGVSSLPNGAEYYKACLKWHTSLDITPEEVHQKGLAEVDRIAKEMEKVMTRLNFTTGTSIGEAFASMAKDSQFLINDGEVTTLERFREIIFKRIQPKLQKYFKNIPELPLQVKNSPSDGISGMYRAGSEDGTIPGIFYANVRRPEDNPTYSMVSLCLHEALPGHHLARSYGLTSDLPSFRKYYRWRTFSVPYYFPYFNSYGEGWGLYSEYLGEEMGIYETDYELMGRYSDEMWRACRLVIDTGIHYYNWTRDEAINYMLNYTANSKNIAEIEVDRYATWPGQACGYKIGELKIKELRRHAEEVLGNMFDIKDFHDVVLNNGPMPLNILEILVNNWIDSKQENSKQIERTECLTSTAVSYIQRNIIPSIAGVYLAVKFSLNC